MLQSPEVHPVRYRDIANWLRRQENTWWVVDGDPRFSRRLSMPASEGDLAEFIERACAEEETLEVLVPQEPRADKDGVGYYFAAGGEGYGRELQAKGGYDGHGILVVEQTEWVNEANAEVMKAGRQ
jgi:hypothetical protein